MGWLIVFCNGAFLFRDGALYFTMSHFCFEMGHCTLTTSYFPFGTGHCNFLLRKVAALIYAPAGVAVGGDFELGIIQRQGT